MTLYEQAEEYLKEPWSEVDDLITQLLDRCKSLEVEKDGARWKGYKSVCLERDTAIKTIKKLTDFIQKEEYRADHLVDKIEGLGRNIEALEQENARYREALAFYANQTNWFIRFGRSDESITCTGSSEADMDSGDKARAALGGE